MLLHNSKTNPSSSHHTCYSQGVTDVTLRLYIVSALVTRNCQEDCLRSSGSPSGNRSKPHRSPKAHTVTITLKACQAWMQQALCAVLPLIQHNTNSDKAASRAATATICTTSCCSLWHCLCRFELVGPGQQGQQHTQHRA